MSKKHAKKFSCSSKKFIASLPYLRPLSDEEIDQQEIEASWQKFLPKATHEEDFFDWMLDIECAIIDREMDDEICRQMEMRYCSRVRRIMPPTDDFPCFHYDH